MKVAIVGGGPAGLLAAQEFHQLGAEVVLFGETLGGGIRRWQEAGAALPMGYSWSELLPGREEQTIPTIGEYWQEGLCPLSEKLAPLIRHRKERVLRVHKSFLGPEEVPSKGSRLVDLFRVVWDREGIEFYEDFDIVIDASGVGHRPLPAGPGGAPALNEERLEREGWVSKSRGVEEHLSRLSGKERVLVVGSGAMGAWVCQQFFSRFPKGRLDLVTTEAEPFEKLAGEGRYPELLQSVRFTMEESYQRWKQGRGDGPPDFCIYNGYNVVSIDKLEDQQNLFVTISAPVFRRGTEGIKTLSVEGVLVATGFERPKESTEPGLYYLGGDIPQVRGQIAQIQQQVLSFFSRA